MRIRYFQQVHDIRNTLERILESKIILRDNGAGSRDADLAKHWGYGAVSLEQVQQDLDAVSYICYLRHNFARGKGYHKPTQEQVNSVLTRYKVYLSTVHGCTEFNLNERNQYVILSRKEYKACNHYLFQFSLQVWYDKLPDYIPTLTEKHGNAGEEKELPIPYAD